ncbi:MAG: helix-turn-helix domain-containing protein [Magnetovibrionaceae bacterium]
MAGWPVLIRSYRQQQGLKQDALAYFLQVDQTTISRWERGVDTPSIAMQKRLRDLMYTGQDSALETALRIVRASPGRASIVLPGARIVDVSKSQAEHFGSSPQEMKGNFMWQYYGRDYYEEYMLPLARHGIYSDDVSRLDLITKSKHRLKGEQYSQITITPLHTTSGVFALSQCHSLSAEAAGMAESLKVYRFDEMV